MILGLTGSLGSGKSFVADCLRDLGATVIDADVIAREATAPGSPALDHIRKEFGPGVFSPDGSLDRAALARVVFADATRLAALEAILHPLVRAREEELIALNRHRPLTVLDIPLLYETGAETLCDAVLSVTVDEAVRRARLVQDRGMSDEQIARRLSRQLPQEEKNRRAQHVIDNSGTREETRAAVEKLHVRLVGREKASQASTKG